MSSGVRRDRLELRSSTLAERVAQARDRRAQQKGGGKRGVAVDQFVGLHIQAVNCGQAGVEGHLEGAVDEKIERVVAIGSVGISCASGTGEIRWVSAARPLRPHESAARSGHWWACLPSLGRTLLLQRLKFESHAARPASA